MEAEEGKGEGAQEKEPLAQRDGLPGVFEAAGGDRDPAEAGKANGEQGAASADATVKSEKPAGGEALQSEGGDDSAKMEVDTDKGDSMDVDKQNPPKE